MAVVGHKREGMRIYEFMSGLTNLLPHRSVMITIVRAFALASHVFMPTHVCLALVLTPKYIALVIPERPLTHTSATSNSPFRGPSSPRFRNPIPTTQRLNSIRPQSVQRNFGPRQPKQMATRNYSNSFGTAPTNFTSRFFHWLQAKLLGSKDYY